MANSSLRWGRVAAIHPEDYSVDLVMTDDGSRLAGVQVLTPFGSTASGFAGMATPAIPDSGNVWELGPPTNNEVKAGVAFFGSTPVVVGFLFPQVCQMLFSEIGRVIERAPSDFYTTVDSNANFEAYHPSGTYVRIGTSPAHEDLTGKDFDGKWRIAKNTDKAVHVHVSVASGGAEVASLDIDPSGNLTGHFNGTADITTAGSTTIHAPSVTIDSPQTTCTGKLTVEGLLTYQAGMAGSGGSGASAMINGNVVVTGGDVTANGISLEHHVHSGVQSGGSNTGGPL